MILNCGIGEDSWESLGLKEIKPVHPKGNQSWTLTDRTDAEAEAETPILWQPDVKNWLIAKEPDAEKDWRREEKGITEDEVVGWHHWLNGHEFEQTLGDGEGQGSLVCYSLWGCKESDTTDWTARINCFLYVYLFYLLITMTVVKSSTLKMVMYSTFGNKRSTVLHFWVKQFLPTHKTNLQGSTYQSDINSSHIKGYLPFPCLADFPECK